MRTKTQTSTVKQRFTIHAIQWLLVYLTQSRFLILHYYISKLGESYINFKCKCVGVYSRNEFWITGISEQFWLMAYNTFSKMDDDITMEQRELAIHRFKKG